MEAKARTEARRYAEQGMAYLAHALNACDIPDTHYRYGVAEQEKFKALVLELIDIVENGKIEISPNARARSDKDFQRFMKALKAD